MTTVEIELGVQDRSCTIPKFDPGVRIEIMGDHALVMEVLAHLETFGSSAGPIVVK